MPHPLPKLRDPAPPPPNLEGKGPAAHDVARRAQWARLQQQAEATEEARTRAWALADSMLDTSRAYIRYLVGSAPWVQGVYPCRVRSIDDTFLRRCTVQLLESGGIITNVQYDPTVPQIDAEYAARRTVRLNPASPRGAPEEVHWTLKVSRQIYLYWFDAANAIWRVPFPLPQASAPGVPPAAELVVAALPSDEQVQRLWADDAGHVYADITHDQPFPDLPLETVRCWDAAEALPAPLIQESPPLPPQPDVSPSPNVLELRSICVDRFPSPLMTAAAFVPETVTIVEGPGVGERTETDAQFWREYYSLDFGTTWVPWYTVAAQTTVSHWDDYPGAPSDFTITVTRLYANFPIDYCWARGEPATLEVGSVLYDASTQPFVNRAPPGGPFSLVPYFTPGQAITAWGRSTAPQTFQGRAGLAVDAEVQNALNSVSAGDGWVWQQSTDGGATWTTPNMAALGAVGVTRVLRGAIGST